MNIWFWVMIHFIDELKIKFHSPSLNVSSSVDFCKSSVSWSSKQRTSFTIAIFSALVFSIVKACQFLVMASCQMKASANTCCVHFISENTYLKSEKSWQSFNGQVWKFKTILLLLKHNVKGWKFAKKHLKTVIHKPLI